MFPSQHVLVTLEDGIVNIPLALLPYTTNTATGIPILPIKLKKV